MTCHIGTSCRVLRVGQTMKYSQELVIARPIGRVIELFDEPTITPLWREGLLCIEPLTGAPGEPGSTSKWWFQVGERMVEMIETVTVHNLPQELSMTYEGPATIHSVRNSFQEIDAYSTRWRVETDIQFTGFMKLLKVVTAGLYKLETQKIMQVFKDFAETHSG